MAERTKWVVVGAVVCALATLLGASIGVLLTSGSAKTPIPSAEQQLTTTVTDDPVRDSLQVEVIAQPVSTLMVERQGIHTATGVAGGTTINEGDVVTVVNEQATLVLRGDFPLYRRLVLGRTGKDVAQLRTALVRLKLLDAPAGVSLDRSMAEALLALFSRAGYPLRDASGNPATAESLVVEPNMIAVLGSLPAMATGTCGVQGSPAASPVCTLTSEKSTLLIEFLKGEAAGQQSVEVVLRDGRVLKARVGAAVPGSGDLARFLIDFEEGQQPARSEVSAATLIRRQSESGALSVPAAALREVSGSRAKLQLVDGKTQEVTIGFCAQGRCVVTGDGLKPGTKVRVP